MSRKLFSFFTICIAGVLTANFVSSGSKFSIIPFLLIGYFVWWSFSLKYKLSAIFILICFNESFFKLLRTEMDSRLIEDVALFLMISLIFPQIAVVLNAVNERYEHYSKYIILYWIVIFLSLIAGSYFIFGQPIIAGIIPARKYLFIISYFFLAAIGFNLNDFSKFMQILSITGAILATLILIDIHILGGGILFNYTSDVIKLRFESIRFSVSSFIIVVACIYNYICARNSLILKEKLFHLSISLVCFLEILICNMTRARIAGLLFVLFLIHVKKFDFKKIVGLIVLFVCISYSTNIFTSSSILGNVGKSYTLTHTELKTAERGAGNIAIRIKSFFYFTNLWLIKSPVFGVGVFSETRFSRNPMTSAELKYGYHISDIRTMDTFVRFGIPGAMVLIALYLKLFSNIKQLWQKCTRQEHIILSTILYILIYTLLTPTLGNILTNNLMYYGMFIYYISLLNKKHTAHKAKEVIV